MSASTVQLACPRCGYDLSGKAAAWTDHCPLTGTCSECGLELDWIILHHPERLAPRWSIEHAPRLTPLVVLKSAFRAFAPWSFWRSLRMEHALRPGRLIGVLLALPIYFYLVCVLGMFIVTHTPWGWRNWSAPNAPTDWSTIAFPMKLLSEIWPRVEVISPIFILVVVTGLWTLLMPMTYFVLTDTMRTCKVRPMHLLRIGVCSFAGWAVYCGSLLLIVFTVADAYGLGLPGVFNVVPGLIIDYHPILLVAWFIWFILYWCHATRTYLKLPHTISIVTLMTILAGLATLVVIVAPALYF